MKFIKNISFLLLLGFLAFACCKKKTAPQPEQPTCKYGLSFQEITDISLSQNGIIPCAIGNYWVYADSTWKNDTLISTGIDTVKITKASYTIFNNEIDKLIIII